MADVRGDRHRGRRAPPAPSRAPATPRQTRPSTWSTLGLALCRWPSGHGNQLSTTRGLTPHVAGGYARPTASLLPLASARTSLVPLPTSGEGRRRGPSPRPRSAGRQREGAQRAGLRVTSLARRNLVASEHEAWRTGCGSEGTKPEPSGRSGTPFS